MMRGGLQGIFVRSPSYLRQLLDRPDRIRDVDAFLAVAARERFDEFVFQEELVVEVAAVQDDVEVDARLAESGEAHERRLFHLAVDACEDFVGHLERDLFYKVEVAVVDILSYANSLKVLHEKISFEINFQKIPYILSCSIGETRQ